MFSILLAEGSYLDMLVTDFLWKAAIIAVVVLIVLVAMVVIYKKVGSK